MPDPMQTNPTNHNKATDAMERLGESLFALSDKLRASGILSASDTVHDAYERVVAEFTAMEAARQTTSGGEGDNRDLGTELAEAANLLGSSGDYDLRDAVREAAELLAKPVTEANGLELHDKIEAISRSVDAFNPDARLAARSILEAQESLWKLLPEITALLVREG